MTTIERIQQIDEAYDAGCATMSDVKTKYDAYGATACFIQKIHPDGSIELDAPLDAPKWLVGKAVAQKNNDERRDKVIARLRRKKGL